MGAGASSKEKEDEKGTPHAAAATTLSTKITLDLSATVQEIAAQLVPYYNADPERVSIGVFSRCC